MPKKKPEPKRSSDRIDAKVARAIGTDRKKDRRWWLHGDEAHLTVFADAERMARVTRQQRQRDLYHASLYDDDGLATLIAGPHSFASYVPEILSSNIVRRQIDTFTAKLSKNRPVPMGLTTGGNYSQQRRTKALSQFFAGALDKVNYWETREQRLRDGAIFGDGFAFNYRVGRTLKHDRIFPFDLEVDPYEGMLGKPRTFRFKRYIDRLLLQERYPDFAEQIDEAQGKADDDRWDLGWDETCDLVLLRGVWHLPSEDNADGGAFSLCVSTATLELKEYRRSYPPFSRFTFAPGVVGWRGTGMAHQLAPLQYEVNAIGARLQEQAYMTGSYVFVENGAGIETDTIDNGTLTLVRYNGSQPIFHNPQPFHPQLFDYYMNLRGRFAAEESRISELTTRGEMPNISGRARRLHHDIEAEGFTPQGRADERDVINTCWQLFDLIEEIQDEQGDEKDERKPYVLKVEKREHGRSVLEDVKYDDVRMDRDSFTLRVFPTSFLSGTPEDRLETVRELTDSGFLSQDEALSLLDFPDLQGVLNLRTSARRNIERLLEKLKDADDPDAPGIYEYPEPEWNLQLCKALALMTYLEAKLDGVPEKNLKKILQFAIDSQSEIDNATAAAAPPPADGAPPPEEMPVDPGMEQFAPPEEPLMPANAVAPEVMPMLPEMQ